jgi:hypothetical protein
VVAAVGEGDDRRVSPKLRQAFVYRLVVGEGAVRAAAAVEEDEEGSLAPRLGLCRHDDVDAELSPDRLAVHVQVNHARPVLIGGGESRRGKSEIDGSGGDHGEDGKRCRPAPSDLAARGAARVVHQAASIDRVTSPSTQQTEGDAPGRRVSGSRFPR